jgi:YidC/Oxa1 family membrane protein insertase
MLSLFSPIGTLFGWLMYHIYEFTHNYGVTLIIFTILLKVLMIPIGVRQQKGVIANAKMAPKMAALQKMYGNNRERYGEELQKLYKEEHFSPMSSCLPTLVMFPILFGMLDVVYYPLKHMLRMTAEERALAVSAAEQVLGTGNLNRYSAEISALNAVKIDPAPFVASLGEELAAKMQAFDFTMFGLPLGEQPSLTPGDKSVGLWLALLMVPILSGVFAFLMGKLSMKNTPQASEAPGGNAMSNMMIYTMPLMSVWISFIVPVGVGIYWLFSNILSLIQQLILNKVMNPAEAIAKAQAEAEEQKERDRLAKIEAKKQAREAQKTSPERSQPSADKESDSYKIAEARRRMLEKYGDESQPDKKF